MFNPSDRQDVPTAYNLLQDLWTIPSVSDDLRPSYVKTREAIRTWGTLCYHLVTPYTCVDLSLSEQLEHLSAAAHLTLSLYDLNHETGNPADNLMPTILYLDIMHMIKNTFFCVTKAQVDIPESEFFLILLGTDRLETLFGILRTMVGNDANLDLVQLSLCLTGTTKMANILAKYPEWDKSPRRLHLPFVTRDSKTIPDSADHANPRLWRGSVFVALVTLLTCWKRGRQMVEDRFVFAAPALARICTNPKATILAPYGVPLYKIPLSDDDYEDVDDEEVSAEHGDADADTDVLDGMRLLEDAAAEVEWNYSPTPKKFTRTVKMGNEEVNKARAIADRFKYQKSASSTDRLRRVAHKGRYNSIGGLIEPEDHFHGPQISLFDPIATLLLAEDKFFLCIGEVNGISVDSTSRDRIPIYLLPESTVRVSFQALHLAPATAYHDPSERYDWRSSHPLQYQFTVPGSLVQPVNPVASRPTGGPPCLLFDSGSLRALAASLRDRLSRAHLQSVPSAKVTLEFPYREALGMSCST